MRTGKSAVAIIALAMLGTACGGGADATSYCDALVAMAQAAPAEGVVTGQFEADMVAYAAAVDDAADTAPSDQEATLRNFADALRFMAPDPTAEGVGERMMQSGLAMLSVQAYGERECGIDFEAAAGRSQDDTTLPPIDTSAAALDQAVLDAINSAVPADVDLTFESMVLAEDDNYPMLVAAPVGWERSDFSGFSFEPGPDFEFFTEIEFDTGCDGFCVPQDWRPIIYDSSEFSTFGFLNRDGEVILDEELSAPDGRLVVFSRPSRTIVKVARYDDAADKFFVCRAELDDGDAALWEVFAAACRSSVALWLPAG